MLQEQLEAYAPHMRDAYREVVGHFEPQYIRQEDLDLANTADTAPWTPSQLVREYVSNIDDVQVRLLDDSINLDGLLLKFIRDVNIGLVLMGQNVTRRKRPSLIVLTTKDVFYAIDPDFRKGIQFLDRCLKDERLTFWTTNGLHESNCLLEQFNISLQNSRARDCLGMHLHLMKVLNKLEDRTRYQAMYPAEAIYSARRTLRLESFNKLIYIWLDIKEPDNILDIPNQQMAHLAHRPLNLTAINLIKKRCSLVIRLSEALVYFVKTERNLINTNIINTLTNLREDTSIKAMRNYIRKCEDEKRPIENHFVHLDNPNLEDPTSDDDS
jgi:hypothetical protein